MQPIRVKFYGMILLTRRTYLLTQAVGLCVFLALMAVGGAAILTVHTWLHGSGIHIVSARERLT